MSVPHLSHLTTKVKCSVDIPVCLDRFQVKGFPANQGALYRRNVENLFTCCVQEQNDPSQRPKIHFEETK